MSHIFSKEQIRQNTCTLYLAIYEELIIFFRSKLGAELSGIFMPNSKILKF